MNSDGQYQDVAYWTLGASQRWVISVIVLECIGVPNKLMSVFAGCIVQQDWLYNTSLI